jgi:hypothetical protein
MPTDCTDVCEVIIDKLLEAGFTRQELKLDVEDNHDAILDALTRVRFVRMSRRALTEREKYEAWLKFR